MWILRLALRRPYTIAVLCVVIAILGSLSITRMKVDMLPNIDIPVVIAVWQYSGLSAEEMERRVTYPAERGYSTAVSGISYMESQSIAGISVVKVFFEPGTDIGGSIAGLGSASSLMLRYMPPGMQPPLIVRFNASNVPVAQITVSGEGVSEQPLFDYGLNFLRLRLFTIPGLSAPAPYGGRMRQVMVDIDLARTAARGLSPQDVAQAVLQSNIIIPAGSVRVGSSEYDVQLNSSPTSLDEFNQMPVKMVNGTMVLLRDVAYVHDGFAVQTNIARVNGKRATYLTVVKKADASTLAVIDATRELLPALQATAPNGVVLKLEFDQSVFVRGAVMNVLYEVLIASLLVSFMILFFLGSWRSTVLVISSIPLALLCGVIGLNLTNQTLNLMTLGGLALAVGMLVDDATVAVENIHRNRLMDKNLTTAILDGAQQIAVPALAATSTICIVFFPVVLLDGAARYLFTPLALSVVFSMVASYVLSRTLVPALARKLMAGEAPHLAHGAEGKGLAASFNASREMYFNRFREGYVSMLQAVLRHRWFVLAGATAFIAIGLMLIPVVGMDFFPSVDTGQMKLHVRAPAGYRIEQTEHSIELVEDEIRKIVPSSELDTINVNIGLPQFYNLAFVQTDNTGGNDAEMLIALKPGHAPTAQYMRRVREELFSKFPDLGLYFQPADLVSQVLNFGLSAPLDIQVEGRDLPKMQELTTKLLREIKLIPGVVDVRLAQVFQRPGLRVDVDRQRGALIGLTQRDVANSMLTSLSSSAVVTPNFWVNPSNGVNYAVAVQTPIEQLRSIDSLMATPVSPANQSTQPSDSATSAYLGAISHLTPFQSRASASHYSVQPVLNVQASVDGRDLGAVATDIDKIIKSLVVPTGIKVRLRGQSDSMFSSFKSLGMGLILAAVLVYLLMVVLFQSWVDPFIIMFSVPGALVGILALLVATGSTLNVPSFMGSIMAIGIAVSNSILMVSFANETRMSNKGLSAVEAVTEAGRTRLRPVLMTAIAMILGMLPMAMGHGEGGEQNAPLGRAVIGGLLLATLFTLFIVPAVYAVLRKSPPSMEDLDRQFEAETENNSSQPASLGAVAQSGEG